MHAVSAKISLESRMQGCHNLLTINPKKHNPKLGKTLYLMGVEHVEG